VARFVKYTGYGNAAGLLAQRGLLCGGCGADYSSESDESETEEYSQLRDRYGMGGGLLGVIARTSNLELPLQI